MASILEEVQWRDDKITMFGKTYPQARLVAWHGPKNLSYTYTKIKMVASGWTKSLKYLNDTLVQDWNIELNSALVNYYRDGQDHMSWHQDNEPELGENPIIASLSFGAAREFFFRHEATGEKIKLELCHGDLLLMGKDSQRYWKHSLPKRLKVKEPRMNITFRFIKNELF